MSFHEATPTTEELSALNLDELLAGAESSDCRSYANKLLAPGRAPEKGTAEWRALVLLSFALGLRLDPDDKASPLKASGWFGELGPNDLQPEQLAALEGWLPSVSNPEIVSRVADILWLALRPRKHEHKLRAAEAYRASATRVASAARGWPAALPRFQRAFILAPKGGADAVTHAIEQLLEDGSGLSLGHRDARLMQLLIDQRVSDPSKWGPAAEARAERLELEAAPEPWGTTVTLEIAREFWEAAEGWRIREHGAEGEEVAEIRRRIAETYIMEADKARDAEQPPVEAALLGRAVTALRRAGRPGERAEELVARMMDAQARAPQATIGRTLDVTEEAARGSQCVEGCGFQQALSRLALVPRVPRIARLRQEAKEYFERYSMARLFPITLTSTDHRVVKQMPALSDDAGDDEPAMRWRMWYEAQWIHSEICGFVHGAQEQLLLEHQPRVADLIRLVRSSWLVPPGHELLFARGLHAGLYGDYAVAIHLLIPQFENGLRFFVELHLGKTVVSHHDDGTQMARLLDRLLRVPELSQVLGEDLVFDLQGLLIRQEGQNLRNNLCHGLVGDQIGQSGMYFWWLCLRMTVMLVPVRKRQEPSADETAAASAEVDAAASDDLDKPLHDLVPNDAEAGDALGPEDSRQGEEPASDP